ncbi:MAG: hypothetical protein KGJ77_03940 [Acidobacteriota bacterium]|nr:hypothetical protein [Acidobacteriota bacterium]
MTPRRSRRWRYVPAAALEGRPHVVVDGAPRPGTRCTLSHWPATPTPEELWADTSAGIVRRALARPRSLPKGVEVATIDHYDADGIIALGLLTVDGLDERCGDRLERAAAAGDFDVVADRRDALVAFALGALGRAEAGGGPGSGGDDLAAAAARGLEALPGLAEDPGEFEALWGAEAAAYDAAVALAADGALGIEEHPQRDLAVVRVDPAVAAAAGAGWAGAVVHRAVVHSATSCLRVATVAGDRLEVRYRYETWVRLASRRPRPRVDLGALARTLTEAEPDGGSWLFDGAGAITPALHRPGGAPSGLDPERFLTLVGAALDDLDRGAPAWDPYARVGSVPVTG